MNCNWKLENVCAKVKSQQPRTVNRKVGILIKKWNCLARVTWCGNMNSNSIYNTFIYLSGALQLSNTSCTLVTFNKESEGKSQDWNAAIPQWPLSAKPASYWCLAWPWSLEHVSVGVQRLDEGMIVSFNEIHWATENLY